MGGGCVGTGVLLQDVARSYNSLLGSAGKLIAGKLLPVSMPWPCQAAQINNVFKCRWLTGLTATLQSFTNALQTVSTSPPSSAGRQAFAVEAQSPGAAVAVLQLTGVSIHVPAGDPAGRDPRSDRDRLADKTSLRLDGSNATEQSGTQQQPNDLLDQRDQLISQLRPIRHR